MNFTKELQDFLNQAPLAIIISDIEGLIKVVNHKSEALFGYEPGELIGRPIEYLLPDGLSGVHEKHKEENRVDPPKPLTNIKREQTGRRKDGRPIPVEVGSSVFRREDPVQVVSFISERIQAESNLRLFSRAVEQSISSVIITDTSGAIVYVNPTFLRLSGYSADEVIGKTPEYFEIGCHPCRKISGIMADHQIRRGMAR